MNSSEIMRRIKSKYGKNYTQTISDVCNIKCIACPYTDAYYL